MSRQGRFEDCSNIIVVGKPESALVGNYDSVDDARGFSTAVQTSMVVGLRFMCQYTQHESLRIRITAYYRKNEKSLVYSAQEI